jgi:protein-S-isoprenylcysteine O-methyltransferase Ste14
VPIDQTFRWVLLGVGLPFLVAIHANFLRLSLSRATFYHRNEPKLLAAGVRICVVPCIVGMLLYMVDPTRLDWARAPLPSALRWLGAPLLVGSELLFCWALSSLGQSFSVSLAIFDDHTLVQTGPYRWLRHPMYSAVLGIGVALFLVTANGFLVGCLALAALLVTVFRTPIEERTLHAHFGARYAKYASETGRYWPRFHQRARAARHVDESLETPQET